ncbi:unnamed protein product [Moneuplotes crassus]|uniref:Secreted protein n=1 Tax=Euplotes crassus TaxID=5936 RepID=A0AAD2D8L6_EUPCR|nr:unnamed protein product [Moneuplotes crassus]
MFLFACNICAGLCQLVVGHHRGHFCWLNYDCTASRSCSVSNPIVSTWLEYALHYWYALCC